MSQSNGRISLHAGANLEEGVSALSSEAVPDPEVTLYPGRRRFSAAYKLRIVEEAARCTEPGEIGALLRREGLYDSHLSQWRKQYHSGGLDALKDSKRGRKPKYSPLEKELEKLRKENARLTRRLEQAETIIEIQKKAAAMLGEPLSSTEDERNS